MTVPLIERFRDRLPVTAATPVVSLGEGATPLLAAPRLARAAGIAELWLKWEASHPTGSDKDRGMTVAVSKAVEEGAAAVLCASTGNTAASSAAYAARAGIPAVVLTPQGAVAGAYIARTFKGKNIAVVHDKTTYGKGLADETKKALNKAGIKEKLYESYNKGDKDFNALVSKLKLNNIDLVYVGGYHQESGLILRQMRDQGVKATLMAGDALADKEFASITGPAADGVLFTFGPDPRNKATAKAIVDKFKAKNIDPEGYTLYTYAAFQVWTQAVAKAKTTDAKKVAGVMKQGSYDTVLGTLSFDAKGDITILDYVVYKWDAKGNYAELPQGKPGS